jgi:conjugative relaxase-like TrwC/TraI family protein
LGRRLRSGGVRGFDLTFSAPKSVSVLAAICGGVVERAVIAAHDEAVRAVIEAIEERATTRSGANGIYRSDVTGVAALLVRHRTSRTLDPSCIRMLC